jgi:hypothetical protein
LHLDLTTPSPEKGQKILLDVCGRMKREGVIEEFNFEIMIPDGTVTEKCVLSSDKVIA